MLYTDKKDTNILEMLTHPHPWASSKKKKKTKQTTSYLINYEVKMHI